MRNVSRGKWNVLGQLEEVLEDDGEKLEKVLEETKDRKKKKRSTEKKKKEEKSKEEEKSKDEERKRGGGNHLISIQF